MTPAGQLMSTGSLKLHYQDIGEGPAVILLHGAGPGATSFSNFQSNIPALSSHFRLLLVDHPGFGGSDKPEFTRERPIFTATADALADLLDELAIDQADVIGNSLGGGSGLKLAMAHPNRVRRLVLMGPAGAAVNIFSSPMSEGLSILHSFYSAPKPDRETLEKFLRVMVYDQSLITDELIEQRWSAASDDAAFQGQQRVSRSLGTPSAEDQLWRDLHRVKHPILMIWGRDDRVVPMDAAFFALRRFQDARLHVFPKCGHWAQVERRSEFDELVINFLSSPLSVA